MIIRIQKTRKQNSKGMKNMEPPSQNQILERFLFLVPINSKKTAGINYKQCKKIQKVKADCPAFFKIYDF